MTNVESLLTWEGTNGDSQLISNWGHGCTQDFSQIGEGQNFKLMFNLRCTTWMQVHIMYVYAVSVHFTCICTCIRTIWRTVFRTFSELIRAIHRHRHRRTPRLHVTRELSYITRWYMYTDNGRQRCFSCCCCWFCWCWWWWWSFGRWLGGWLS